MTDKEKLQSALRAFIVFLDHMSPEEFTDFVNSNNGSPSLVAKNDKVLKTDPSSIDFESLINKMRESKSRDEARLVLKSDERMLLRKNMNVLARLLKVNVLKQDKRDDIENKVIEFIIGSRLRTEAIQGLNLKK
jgi:hypothetical protein